jgi:hypothetical protein
MSILDKISNKEVRRIIKQFVKPSNLWYVNIWIDGMALTSEQRAKGIIPPYEHSVVERKMVASKQTADLYKLLKQK